MVQHAVKSLYLRNKGSSLYIVVDAFSLEINAYPHLHKTHGMKLAREIKDDKSGLSSYRKGYTRSPLRAMISHVELP